MLSTAINHQHMAGSCFFTNMKPPSFADFNPTILADFDAQVRGGRHASAAAFRTLCREGGPSWTVVF
jgi:hypothetical protein